MFRELQQNPKRPAFVVHFWCRKRAQEHGGLKQWIRQYQRWKANRSSGMIIHVGWGHSSIELASLPEQNQTCLTKNATICHLWKSNMLL